MQQTLLNVLIIEDRAADLETTLRLLRSSGFEPVWRSVQSAAAYVEALSDPPDIILADYTLPNFSARTALELLKENNLDIPFIVLSGTLREEAAVECMKLGAADYLASTRRSTLGESVRQALDSKSRRDARDKERAHQLMLSLAVEQSSQGVAITDLEGSFLYANGALAEKHGFRPNQLRNRPFTVLLDEESALRFSEAHETAREKGEHTGEFSHRTSAGEAFPGRTTTSVLCGPEGAPFAMVHHVDDITEQKNSEKRFWRALEYMNRSNKEWTRIYDETLEGWVRFLDLRDHTTVGHSQRVTKLTLDMAKKIGFNGEHRDHLRRGALLHDIGKMGIPDRILQKPGPLDEEEWVVMRQHPEYAYHILSAIDFLKPALDIPRYHHEKWDGSGYPGRLAGDEIPLPARLFAIVDVWDALNSDRPYRKAWPQDEVVRYLRKQSGVHFDPEFVPVFLDHVGSPV